MGCRLTSDEIVKVIKPNIAQHQNEAVWLHKKIKKLKPKTILEIGCCGGGLTALLATTGATVITIDILKSKIYVWKMKKFLDIYPNPKIRFILGDSNSQGVYEKVKGEYDAVIIDGGHDWETGYKDWLLYGPLSNVIAIHDIADYENKHGTPHPNNVWDWFPTEFWWDIKNPERLEEKNMSNHKVGLDFEYKTDEFVDVLSGGWGIIYKDGNS